MRRSDRRGNVDLGSVRRRRTRLILERGLIRSPCRLGVWLARVGASPMCVRTAAHWSRQSRYASMAAFSIRRRRSLEIAWEAMPCLLSPRASRRASWSLSALGVLDGLHRVSWHLDALASPDAQSWWLVASRPASASAAFASNCTIGRLGCTLNLDRCGRILGCVAATKRRSPGGVARCCWVARRSARPSTACSRLSAAVRAGSS
jgi:hypothetical protein